MQTELLKRNVENKWKNFGDELFQLCTSLMMAFALISVQPSLDNPLINMDDNVKNKFEMWNKKYDPCPGLQS